MQFYEYRGYTIYPDPHLVIGSGCWGIELLIRHDISTTTYRNDNVYATEGEAVFHSILYGKKLIDGGTVLLQEAL